MKQGKEPNYAAAVRRALGSAQIPPGFHNVQILHDGWCAIFRGGACDCNPEIRTPFAGKN